MNGNKTICIWFIIHSHIQELFCLSKNSHKLGLAVLSVFLQNVTRAWPWLFLLTKIFRSPFSPSIEWILWRCARHKPDPAMFWAVVIFITPAAINGCNDSMFLFFFSVICQLIFHCFRGKCKVLVMFICYLLMLYEPT